MNIKDKICTKAAESAVKALLYEVSATPKPGLVDRENNGAHLDMDFFTFLSSASVLYETFYDCTVEGFDFDGHDHGLLLDKIRPMGIRGEEKMFKATKGINTHKGLIFSLGVLCAAFGSLCQDPNHQNPRIEEICQRARDITKGITKKDFKEIGAKSKLSYGEKLYVKYGITGIRGEVEGGFKTVLKQGIPVMKEYLKQEENLNHIMVQVLLNLMTATEDSNVLGRHDMKTLEYVKEQAKEALDLGGAFTKSGIDFIRQMDRTFIERNISPGGSADLLAVTILLFLLENEYSIGGGMFHGI